LINEIEKFNDKYMDSDENTENEPEDNKHNNRNGCCVVS